MIIHPVDFEDDQVRGLISLHLAGMHENSPPESVQALDLSGLQDPSVQCFGLWDGDSLMSIGAIRELTADTGEIKSMRTSPHHLRRGAAAQILDHLLAVARNRGYRRVSLETGRGPAFEPAIALYRRYGFSEGERFGDYEASRFNQFFHLDLGKDL